MYQIFGPLCIFETLSVYVTYNFDDLMERDSKADVDGIGTFGHRSRQHLKVAAMLKDVPNQSLLVVALQRH